MTVGGANHTTSVFSIACLVQMSGGGNPRQSDFYP